MAFPCSGPDCGRPVPYPGHQVDPMACDCERSIAERRYKHWTSIFAKDAVLTSALLDRLLHHAETVLIEGKSHRSKDQVEI